MLGRPRKKNNRGKRRRRRYTRRRLRDRSNNLVFRLSLSLSLSLCLSLLLLLLPLFISRLPLLLLLFFFFFFLSSHPLYLVGLESGSVRGGAAGAHAWREKPRGPISTVFLGRRFFPLFRSHGGRMEGASRAALVRDAAGQFERDCAGLCAFAPVFAPSRGRYRHRGGVAATVWRVFFCLFVFVFLNNCFC